jgi:amphi-Trp domain-containing protein
METFPEMTMTVLDRALVTGDAGQMAGERQGRLDTQTCGSQASRVLPRALTSQVTLARPLPNRVRGWDRPPRIGDSMELMELKEKTTLSREEAAARLHAIADELASNNDVVIEREDIRFVAHVPDQVHLKVEFEIEEDGTELEIELTW